MKKIDLNKIANKDYARTMLIDGMIDTEYAEYINIHHRLLIILNILNILIFIMGIGFSLIFNNQLFSIFALLVQVIITIILVIFFKAITKIHDVTSDEIYDMLNNGIDIYTLSIQSDMIKSLKNIGRRRTYDEDE